MPFEQRALSSLGGTLFAAASRCKQSCRGTPEAARTSRRTRHRHRPPATSVGPPHRVWAQLPHITCLAAVRRANPACRVQLGGRILQRHPQAAGGHHAGTGDDAGAVEPAGRRGRCGRQPPRARQNACQPSRACAPTHATAAAAPAGHFMPRGTVIAAGCWLWATMTALFACTTRLYVAMPICAMSGVGAWAQGGCRRMGTWPRCSPAFLASPCLPAHSKSRPCASPH